MRALVYSAIEKDRHGDSDKFAMLTPIIKSYLTERGCHNISLAQQVLGAQVMLKIGTSNNFTEMPGLQ